MRYASMLYRFGELYRIEGSFTQAENQYIAALSINPFYAKVQNRLALLYAETDQPDKAISAFKQLKRISEGRPEIDFNIACIYSRKGDSKKAIHWLKKAISDGYDNWSAIESDKDLEWVRQSHEYRKLVNERFPRVQRK